MPTTFESCVEDFILSARRQKSHFQREASRRMDTPRIGQRVQIEGLRDQVFVVLKIDTARHLADLLRLGAVHKMESGVPLAALRVVGDPVQDDFK